MQAVSSWQVKLGGENMSGRNRSAEEIKASLREVILKGCNETAKGVMTCLANEDHEKATQLARELRIGCMYLKLLKDDIDELERKWGAEEIEHKCHNCVHYFQGEYDGSCGSYICKDYSAWEQAQTRRQQAQTRRQQAGGKDEVFDTCGRGEAGQRQGDRDRA